MMRKMLGGINSMNKYIKQYNKEELLSLLKKMLLIRRFEEKSGQMYGLKKIGGFCHLSIGQEALNVGVSACLNKGIDKILTGYRDHGFALALDMDPKAIMAEFFGKATGCSRGKGGSMHLFDKEKGMWMGNGIVGAQIPIATGVAFAEKFKGTKGVAVCLFGDGAIHQGAFHEALNIAKLWKTPTLFICENNKYGMGTAFERVSSQRELYKLGEAYDIKSKTVDAFDILHVMEETKKALDYIRENNDPMFIEMRTYRYRGHSMSDPATYRTKEELEEYKSRDGIETLKRDMQEAKLLSENEWEAMEEEIKTIVEESVKFAEESPEPALEEMYTHVWA